MLIRKQVAKYGAVVVGSVAFLPGMAMAATGPDFSTLTSSVDFSTVVTGVMAVAAALVGVLVAKRGAYILLSFIGR